MAEVLLDTNIILDYVDASRPEHITASMLFEGMCETGEYTPVMSASSLKDAYYILCKEYKKESMVRKRLEALCEVIELKDLTIATISRAFNSDEPDFEDAIIRATAEVMDAKAIITRDEKAFKNSTVPAMNARKFCYEMD